jgi:hypothetical protein
MILPTSNMLGPRRCIQQRPARDSRPRKIRRQPFECRTGGPALHPRVIILYFLVIYFIRGTAVTLSDCDRYCGFPLVPQRTARRFQALVGLLEPDPGALAEIGPIM